MAIERNVTGSSGWGSSDATLFTIPDGASGSAVDAVNLLRPFWAILIRCKDSSKIPGSTTLRLEVAYNSDDPALTRLMTAELGLEWVSGNLPVDHFSGVLLSAVGIQYMRPVLSANASGGAVVIEITGLDPGRGG